MSYNTMNEDLRSIRTKKALNTAMFSLLKKFSFRKITIKEICEEALISRATFYTHYIDKYDLLKHLISELWPKNLYAGDSYQQMEEAVSVHINENISILKNLLYEADNETFGILFDFILSTINLSSEKDDGEHYRIVLSNFYAGGIISYLLWQVNNKLPSDVPVMNRHLYEMIRYLQDWQSKKDK